MTTVPDALLQLDSLREQLHDSAQRVQMLRSYL
jgi:hypothetical protein